MLHMFYQGLVILEALYGKIKQSDADIEYFKRIVSLKETELETCESDHNIVKTYVFKDKEGLQKKIKRVTKLYNDRVVDLTIPIQAMIKHSCVALTKDISKVTSPAPYGTLYFLPPSGSPLNYFTNVCRVCYIGLYEPLRRRKEKPMRNLHVFIKTTPCHSTR